MTPTLFFAPHTCAFGSIVALEWLGAPYRLCRLTPEEIHSEAYRKLNPLAQVPTFKSGEGLLTESFAILQHLGFLGLKKKISFREGTADYDHLNQVMSFLTTSLHPSIGITKHPERFADDESSQEDLKFKATSETIPRLFTHIESVINRHGWLTADHPTIADVYFYGVARGAASFINFDLDFPKVAKLMEKLNSDPGVMFANAIEKGTVGKSSGGFKGEVAFKDF